MDLLINSRPRTVCITNNGYFLFSTEDLKKKLTKNSANSFKFHKILFLKRSSIHPGIYKQMFKYEICSEIFSVGL